MMSGRRARANQLNAQKSTGPRSAEGKQRSAKNARQHGLSVPVTSDPELCKEVERLALIIAGEGASPRRLEAARQIAEPQIDLIRSRRARLQLLNDPRESIKQGSIGEKLEAVSLLIDHPADPEALARIQDITDRQSGEAAPALELGLDILAPKMMRLDRYECRALSRRKKAIRAFDVIYPHLCGANKKENSYSSHANSDVINSQKSSGEKAS